MARNVLITGGNSQIGQQIARLFLEKGYRVTTTGRTGGDICCRLPDEVGKLALVPVDILINAVGGSYQGEFQNQPWQEVIENNLLAPYATIQLFLPRLIEQSWGRIINIGSVAALRGVKYLSAYCAAKHGLLGLTRALAAEVADKGITVNMIAPAYLDVETTRQRAGDRLDKWIALNPQRRLVTPLEVAQTALFLVEQAGVNGQVLVLDGGMVC